MISMGGECTTDNVVHLDEKKGESFIDVLLSFDGQLLDSVTSCRIGDKDILSSVNLIGQSTWK